MPITSREVPQVVVNKLTQAQYDAATKVQDEFYLITDATSPTVVQTTGQSTTNVMSQKAVTDAIPVTNNISSQDWNTLWQ